MDKIVLTDKNQFPTEEIIFSHIGKSKVSWKAIFKYIHANHPDFNEQWRFYNDGKSWLLKVTRKTKTIFWLTVYNGLFKITFYFGDKAVANILECDISDELKNLFKDGKKFGKIHGIVLSMDEKQNVEFLKELISIKIKTK